MEQQNCREETTISENPLRREQTVRSEDLSGELQGELEESQPTESNDDAEARTDFWSVQGDFIYRHPKEARVQLYVTKGGIIPYSTEIHGSDQDYLHKAGCVARKTCGWLLTCGRESKFIRFQDRIHKGHMWSGREIDENACNYQTLESVA